MLSGPRTSRAATWVLARVLSAVLLACAAPRTRSHDRVPGLDPGLRDGLARAWAEAERTGAAPNARLAAVAHLFLGRPYGGVRPDPKPAPLPEEGLDCRCDAFDCVTLVETSLALVQAQAAGGLEDLPRHLEAIRYRHGRRDGYASRLHYFTEWIQDNAARGGLVDLTETLGGLPDPRPIDYMTTHPGAYPALADPETFRAIRAAEERLSAGRRFRLPRERVPGCLVQLQSGDILAFTTATAGLDVCHVGIAWRLPDGAVHVLHASSRGGSVQLTPDPLLEYLARHPAMTGLLVARPAYRNRSSSSATENSTTAEKVSAAP